MYLMCVMQHERDGYHDLERATAIGHDELLSVEAQSPALTAVTEAAALLERLHVEHQGGTLAPGEHDQLAIDQGDTFAEVLFRQIDAPQDLARFQVDLPQA